MTTPQRSTKVGFLIFGLSLLVAVATGANWIGQPFRAVQLVMLLGLGMTAGVSWMQATAHWRKGKKGRATD